MNTFRKFFEVDSPKSAFQSLFVNYLASLGFRKNTHIENNFVRGGAFSFHPESILYRIEVRENGFEIEAKSFFYDSKSLETLVSEFGKKVMSCFENGSHPRVSLLEKIDFKSLCVLSSYLFWPCVLVASLIFGGLTCFYYGALSSYVENVKALQALGSSAYLETLHVGKIVEDFYSRPADIWKASLLMSIFGSGFGLGVFFVMQFVLYKLLPYFSFVFFIFHLGLSVLFSLWLWPIHEKHLMLYILPITLVISLPVFMFLTKNIPNYVKESK